MDSVAAFLITHVQHNFGHFRSTEEAKYHDATYLPVILNRYSNANTSVVFPHP